MKYVVWQVQKNCKPILVGQFETICEAAEMVEHCKQVYEKYSLEMPTWEIRDLGGNKI